MVTSATSLGRSGLYDFIIQRLTAIILGLYLVGMLGYFFMNKGNIDYASWHALMSLTCIRVINMIVLLSIAAHTWIGLWGISTDYLNKHVLTIKAGATIGQYATALRLIFQAGSAVLLLGYLAWGFLIVWGAV